MAPSKKHLNRILVGQLFENLDILDGTIRGKLDPPLIDFHEIQDITCIQACQGLY